MKKLFVSLIALSLSFSFFPVQQAHALTPGTSVNTIWEVNAAATAGNVNAGGFNPSNANFLTTLDFTSATSTAPVASSTTYTFVSQDVNAKLYVKSGTNVNSECWYPITSITSGKATLNATAGAAVCRNLSLGNPVPQFAATTAAGVSSTTLTTSGATFGLDFSQGTGARVAWASGPPSDGAQNFTNDLACTNVASSVCTSASYNFPPAYVGNFLHVTAATNATTSITGQLWGECVSISGNACTLDHNITTAAANMTAGTARLGGAMSLNSTLDDDFFETAGGTNGSGGMRYFLTGSLSFGELVNTSATGGTDAPVVWEGYNALRGDTPTGASRPTVNTGANLFTNGADTFYYNIMFTGTGTGVVASANGDKFINDKYLNNSTTSGRNGISNSGATVILINSEVVSYRGNAINGATAAGVIHAYNSYIHNSNIGANLALTTGYILSVNTIWANFTTTAINMTGVQTNPNMLINNTFVGGITPTGTAISLATGSSRSGTFLNNIFYGFTTPINNVDVQTASFSSNNDYFNNTNDNTNQVKSSTDLAVNPQFTNVIEIKNTTASTSASTLIDTTKNFTTLGVAAGDFVYLDATGGTTAGWYGISSITTTTNANDTLNLDIAAGSHTGVGYVVTAGDNFAVGTNLKAQGTPGAFTGSNTTGYLDIGAVQRQEAAGGSCSTVSYVCVGN